MDQLTPIYRIEFFLDAIVNNSANELDPIYRVEYFLAKIAGREVEIPDPLSRMEMYLAQLCGESVTLPQPQSRTEQYLAAICGEDVDTPPFPIYRIEYWLSEWAGGGSYITLVGDIVRFMASRSAPFRKLQIALEPIQDLHGYDNPWPAGGGKNLCPPFVPTSGTGLTVTANSDGSLSVSGTATASGYITEFATLAQTIPSGTEFVISIKNAVTARIRTFFDNGVSDIYAGSTSSGSITQSVDITKVRLYLFVTAGTTYNFTIYFQLEKGSTATAYAPYSNICPISGRTIATVTRTGKNLLDTNAFVQGTIDADSGNEMISSTRVRSPFIWLLAGSYTISSTNNFQIVFDVYDENKQFIRSESETNWKSAPHTYSLTNNRFVRILFKKANETGISPEELTGEMMELGSTATDYEPYAGNTYTIQLGDTVYGGTLDVTAGKLTIDRAGVDMGTLSWQLREGFGGFSAVVTPTPKNLFVAISSCYPYDGVYSDVSDKAFGYIYFNQVFVRDFAYSDAETLKTALNGQTLVYELATPIEIALTPTQIATLVGENNVWDDGTLTVEVKGEAIT